MIHPNGFLPKKDADPAGPLAWNLALCKCGALRDYRAKTCRRCTRAGSEKFCSGCQGIHPISAFYRRKNGQLFSKCRRCLREKRAAKNHPRPPRPSAAAYVKQRLARDPSLRIAARFRASVWRALNGQRVKKNFHALDLLGCTVPEFRAHIERQWRDGMSWENWGRGRACWHLDHKRPIASFDLTDPEQQRACFHFLNYQPLWCPENIRKHAKWSPA